MGGQALRFIAYLLSFMAAIALTGCAGVSIQPGSAVDSDRFVSVLDNDDVQFVRSAVQSGTISPNNIVLTCDGVNNNTLCTFLRGPNHNPQAAVFGDGIKCINPPQFRFGQQNSGQSGNEPLTVAVPAPTELPGSTFHYAVHYRNPVGGFCLPALFNASNGYTIVW